MKLTNILNPDKINKSKNGEVFTSLWLIDKMIERLPEELLKNPNIKILGPSAGIGNFQIKLYCKLMETLKDIIKDEEKRKTHILEKMLYMVEINVDNKELMENILNPNRKYKLNVICGDYLALDVLKEFGVDGFDLVMENPPFNDGAVGRGTYIWDKFIKKSVEELNENGYLNYITPPGWRKPESERSKNKGLKDLMTEDNWMIYLEMYDTKDGERVFDSSTRFDIYLIKKTKDIKETNILDYKGHEYNLFCKDYPFIPNYDMQQVFQLLAVEGEDTIKVIYSSSAYGSDKEWISKEESKEFKYPVIHTIINSGPRMLYTPTNKKGMFGISKVIFSESGINDVIIDLKGEYGLSGSVIGIVIKNKKEGEQIALFFKSNVFQNIINAFNWSTYRIDWRIFTYIKKEFYKTHLEKLMHEGMYSF